jgi:8-oxo-dGTP pyrophosphatase MutT (NUDIX family)
VPALLAPPELVVARAFIVRDGRVLLVRRAVWDTMPGAWELPGGKVDPDESVEAGLARELFEETRLVAGRCALRSEGIVRSPSGRRVLERFYDVRAHGRPTLSGEHDDLVWHDLQSPSPLPLTPATALALDLQTGVR